MTSRQVLIHAGVHRTGTTSLQHFLAENRAVLAAQRIGYPGQRENHQKLAWGVKRRRAGAAEFLAAIEAAGDVDLVVLSAEDFSTLEDLRWLVEVTRIYPVRVQFYLRRQDHWLMSWYNQNVKWPFSPTKSRMDPDQFLAAVDDFHWLDYDRMLSRWSAVLGQSNVGVGVVEPGQIENVVADFATLLGLDTSLAAEAGALNDSLPVHVLEIARHFDLLDIPPAQRRRLIGAMREALSDREPVARTVYSPLQRRTLLSRFAASNRSVAQRFFARDELFREPLPADDAPYFRFPDLGREELLNGWIAPIVHELLSVRR